MNSEDFIIRLKRILGYYSLTSSTFAETIDVQKSSISHLMSGRNKPSLDFVLKIVDKYPEVALYWLLNGEGSFPKNKENKVLLEKTEDTLSPSLPTPSLFDSKEKISNSQNKNVPEKIVQDKKLIKIILLYDDGSFEEFKK